MSLTHRSGGQPQTSSGPGPSPAAGGTSAHGQHHASRGHRYSCPMTAGHPQPDHDGGRCCRQRWRLEPLEDHNYGMAPVAPHAAFRRQPGGLGDMRPCSRSSARWQASPLPATRGPVKPAQFPFGALTIAVLLERIPKVTLVSSRSTFLFNYSPGSPSDMNWATTLSEIRAVLIQLAEGSGVRMRGSCHRPQGRQVRP